MRIITRNGKIDYRSMLEEISCQERRWQETISNLSESSELYAIAECQIQALKRMKQVCQSELNKSKTK